MRARPSSSAPWSSSPPRSVLWAALLGAAFAAPALAGDDSPPPPPSVPAAEAPHAANPVEAKKWLDQGDVFREEGKWVEAAQAYGKALDADEGSWPAHVRYQEAVVAVGESAALVPQYDDIVKERAGDPFARLHRLRLDPPAARLEALAAVLKARPNDPVVLLEIGRASMALGDAAGATKALEAAWAAKPDTGEILLLSAEALRRAGDAVPARTRLEGALKQAPDLFEVVLDLARLDLLEGKNADSIQKADTVLQMRPSYVAALLVRSEACAKSGKAEDARSALDTVLRIHPDDPDALVAIADLTAKGAGPDGLKKAADLYKKAGAAKGVAQLRVFYGLGWAQERIPALPDAASSYREAGLLAPADAGVVNSVGVVMMKQKKFQDAVLQFKKAIDLDPLGPEAYANMGAVYDEQGDWNEAIKWYTKCLALKGQDKNVRALLCSAFDYEALSNYKKAEDLLERVLPLRPDDAEVKTFYGDNQYFQHKWKNAIKAYQEAVKLDDKNRFAWRGLGLALIQDDKPQDAVAALEKAKGLKADDPPTLLALGDLYAAKECHDLQKAIDDYEAYLKAGGSDTDVATIIEELKKELEAEKRK